MQSQESPLLILFEEGRAERIRVVHEPLVSLNVRRGVVTIVSYQHICSLYARENVLHEPREEINLDEEYGAFGE